MILLNKFIRCLSRVPPGLCPNLNRSYMAKYIPELITVRPTNQGLMFNSFGIIFYKSYKRICLYDPITPVALRYWRGRVIHLRIYRSNNTKKIICYLNTHFYPIDTDYNINDILGMVYTSHPKYRCTKFY